MYAGHESAAAVGAAFAVIAACAGCVVLAIVTAIVYIRRHK